MPEKHIAPDLIQFLGDEKRYIKLFENPENWRSIPLLNYTPLHELKDSSIVRFRGMIQDMFDPEIYLEKYHVLSTNADESSRMQNGKYRDCLVLHSNEKVDFESQENVHGQRRTMFVVSLPAINTWASSFEDSNCCREKCQSSKTHTQKSVKRPFVEESESESMETDEKLDENTTNKRQCTTKADCSTSAQSSVLSAEYLLNSPIPDRPGKACLVKLYADYDSHVLNSIVDVVGYLSVDPSLDASTAQIDEFESTSEIQAQNPPPSLIPRLHAISIRKVESINPLLDSSISEITAQQTNIESVHKDLKILLTQCLFGDELAAEYLLAHLISTVYVRSDLHGIGKFTLNVCNLPQQALPSYTQELYEILELFLTASHYLPMTLDNMNTLQFFPKKDYITNKLTSGILQLAPQTHLVLDETRMQQGKLEANGVRGVQNLAHLIKNQQIKCDFQYYDIDYDADVPILVLSEGRSMLPNDFLIPISADPDRIELIGETLKAAKHYIQPKLDSIRRYLTLAKTINYNMNPGDTEMIQNDFVEMRKANPKVGTDELHRLLVLSRLLAIARGNNTLEKDCWEKAKQMEMERVVRLEKLPTSKRC